MSEHGGSGVPPSTGGAAENLNTLLTPPTSGPVPMRDLGSILLDPTQHFQLDLDQAPQAIAAFRHAADKMRNLMDEARRLGNVKPPGLDAVSINAAKEISQWAVSEEPGSFQSAMESGAIQLENVANALERSLRTYRQTDESNAAQLRSREL
ncbi:MAG: hypothetical protein ACRDRI_01745 [Pseudonocardiaceae bacterium]